MLNLKRLKHLPQQLNPKGQFITKQDLISILSQVISKVPLSASHNQHIISQQSQLDLSQYQGNSRAVKMPNEKVLIDNSCFIEQRQRSNRNILASLDARDREYLFPFSYEFNHSKFQKESVMINEKLFNRFQKIESSFLSQNLQNGQMLKNRENIVVFSKRSFENRRNFRQYSKQDKKVLDDFLIGLSQDVRTAQLLKIQTFTQDKERAYEELNLTNTQQYRLFFANITKYISSMIQNINSIGFDLLSAGKLQQSETKAFSSKNMLQNIQSIFISIKDKLYPEIGKKLGEQLCYQFTRQLNNLLREILIDLSSHYPQASGGGETARMRQAISAVNRLQDEHYDLIFNNQISVIPYFNNDKEDKYLRYSGFIMEVLNAAISSSKQPFYHKSEETVYEKFIEFTQKILSLSYHKQYRNMVSELSRTHEKTQSHQILKQQNRKAVINYFTDLLRTSKMNKADESIQKASKINNLKHFQEETIQQVKKDHKYAIGQKIPNSVKQFSSSQIKSNNFHTKNSSILRIMTKWAQNLEQIFKKPEAILIQRLYPFKNTQNQLKQLSKKQKLQLVRRIKKQAKSVQVQLEQLIAKNNLFQSDILCQQNKQFLPYLRRFSQTRQSSSRINAILIQFTHKYLCVLVHHLLEAGTNIYVNFDCEHINLVSFKIGDLLRSKMECSESVFISIVNTLNLLDDSDGLKDVFKLVRVKNKLEERDNNILINYMFLGKVQCELQLSVQNSKGKQKLYYSYCHFLYQLTRGKFGVLTELAIIVSQYDNVVSSITSKYYKPKKYQLSEKARKKKNEDDQKSIINFKNEQLYICSSCKQIKIKQNIQLFIQSQHSCNQCTISKYHNDNLLPQLKLKSKSLNSFLSQGISNNPPKLSKIRDFKQIADGRLYLMIQNSGKQQNQLKLYRSFYHERELKMFLIGINNKILSNYKNEQLNYNMIQYRQMTSIKMGRLNQLIYRLEDTELEHSLLWLEIQKEQSDQIDNFIKQFQLFRIQKMVASTLNLKAEILDSSADQNKLRIIEDIDSNTKNKSKLKYQKQQFYPKHNLKKLNLPSNNIITTPKVDHLAPYILEINLNCNKIESFQLPLCQNLKILKLQQNELISVDLSKNVLLSEVFLSNNSLTKLDVTQNINLTNLQVYHNNLSTIDITHNRNLSKLFVGHNEISSIDLSNNPKLVYLSASQNNLEEIDISNCQKLTSLYLSNNKLLRLDISQNPQLHTLYCSYNALTTLNTANNVQLSQICVDFNQIKCVDFHRNDILTSVSANNNLLQELDLSANKHLTHVLIDQNNLKQIKFNDNYKLIKVSLSENWLSKIQVMYNSRLQPFNCNFQQSGSHNVQILVRYKKEVIQKCSKFIKTINRWYVGYKRYNFVTQQIE